LRKVIHRIAVRKGYGWNENYDHGTEATPKLVLKLRQTPKIINIVKNPIFFLLLLRQHKFLNNYHLKAN
jgi:hypothetical protein